MLIQFGIISYKLILPFIYPFFFQLRKFIHKDDKTPFFEFFTNYLGYLLHGIVYLIIIKRMKNLVSHLENESPLEILELMDKNEIEEKFPKGKKISISQSPTTRNLIKLEKEKINSRNKTKKYIYLIILACMYLIPMFLDSYSTSSEEISIETGSPVSLFFCIIAYVGLSRIILGDKIYRHQIVALTIIIICTLLIIILMLIGKDFTWSVVLNMVMIALICSLYALYNTLEKRYFNIYMDSPYHLMFFVGLISIILISLYEITTVLAFSKDESFNGIIYQLEKNFTNSSLYILVFIGDIITAFLWVLGIHLTVYFFTPCHFIISEGIAQILSAFINDTLQGLDLARQIIIYILFAIIIFMALIYNEIIIIHLFSLHINTKKFIEFRANSEGYLKEDDDDDTDD